ncbi:hypothetical protein SLEP1_g13626 [Rubroshorea leprosula]|uniref:Uncharacterized protein n=1 Tax=Rubroshorea leprosula TaxID=152421 RepID=A0AAV5IGI4_9ROSI|nr:hypothetical protein SLEP1_g13626 [Rubroshorea leprosula]
MGSLQRCGTLKTVTRKLRENPITQVRASSEIFYI